MRIVPTAHRVLVQLEPVEETTKGGIIISSSDTRKREQVAQETATVVKIGPTAFKDFGDGTPWCKEGDKVKIVRHSGNIIKDPDSDNMYSVINDEDIYAILQEEE